MPPKPASTTQTTMEPKSETMQLTSAITNLCNRSEQFLKAVEEFKQLQQTLDHNFQNQMVCKKRELENLEQDYEQQKRQKRITLEQELQEFGLKSAIDILTHHGDVAIPKADWDKLNQKCKELEQDQTSKLAEALTLERDHAAKNLLIEKNTLQLQHEKDVAKLTSQVEAQQKQLDMAKDELKKAETRLEAERNLCQKIAESSSQPSIVQHVGQK